MTPNRPKAITNRLRLEEAEETLRAIRDGSVDAFVVQEPEGHRVYTLEGSDLPYSALVERMQQGAAMMNASGELVYCNPSLASLLGVPSSDVIGVPLHMFIHPEDQFSCQKMLSEAQQGSSEGEMRLRRADGTSLSARFSFRLLSRDKSAIGVLITDLTSLKHMAELASRMQRTQDEERRRLARELHDSVGQLLAAISMNIAKVQMEVHKLSPEVAAIVQENSEMVDEIGKEIRTVSHLLHPPLLDEVGLPSALRWYIDGFAERSNIEAALDIPDDLPRLSQDAEIAIFRAVQECLTNVHRHSGSKSCVVKIVRDHDNLYVEVSDSGRGMPREKQLNMAFSGGVGLRGMQERLRQLGGTLKIDSAASGTTVRATLPIPGPESIPDRERVN